MFVVVVPSGDVQDETQMAGDELSRRRPVAQMKAPEKLFFFNPAEPRLTQG